MSEPEETMDWVISCRFDFLKKAPHGLSSGLKPWTIQDPIACGKWLQKHGDKSWWPRAAAGYYVGLAEKSPRNAEGFLKALPKELSAKIIEALEILESEMTFPRKLRVDGADNF